MNLISEESEREKEAEKLGEKTIVFGILKGGGQHRDDVFPETLILETVTKVRRRSVVYSDKWKGYDTLMLCGYRHLNVDHGHKFKQGKMCINSAGGFGGFA